MSLDRDERALKTALDRRRPAALPPVLLQRLERVPDEVPQAPSLPVRIGIAVWPWLIATAAAVLLASPVSTALGPAGPTSPGAATAPWNPAATGGVVAPGILDMPIVPLGLAFGVLAVIALARHLRRGGAVLGPGDWPSAVRALRAGMSTRLSQRSGLILGLVFLAVNTVLGPVGQNWDPLVAAEPYAPGPGNVEILWDGEWTDDSIRHATEWTVGGTPCVAECAGPRYLYRVGAGEPYWFLVTVRNSGPLPVTLLGLPAADPATATFGLALLRDAALLSASPENLRAFEPVNLSAGSTVTLALVRHAGACADPAGSPFWTRASGGYPLIYEIAGWRREGDIWPHISTSVAGCG